MDPLNTWIDKSSFILSAASSVVDSEVECCDLLFSLERFIGH